MGLSRFGDQARTCGKCVKAGNEAAAFWVWANMYSNENETDGFLEESQLHTIPPIHITPAKAKALAEKCVEARIKQDKAGLFERCDGGYMIHDFGDFRPSRMVSSELSEKRRKAGKAGSEKRWGCLLEPDSKADGKLDSKTDSKPTHVRACAQVPVQVSLSHLPENNSEESVEDQRGSAEGGSPETGFDLFHRVWDSAYRAKYGTAYPWMCNRREDELAREVGRKALAEGGDRAAELLTHWVKLYLADQGDARWDIAKASHPVRMMGARLAEYCKPLRVARQPAPKKPPAPQEEQLSDAEYSRQAAEALAKITGRIGKGGSAL